MCMACAGVSLTWSLADLAFSNPPTCLATTLVVLSQEMTLLRPKIVTMCIAAPKCKQSARYLCQDRQARRVKGNFWQDFRAKKRYMYVCVYIIVYIYICIMYIYLYTIFIRFISHMGLSEKGYRYRFRYPNLFSNECGGRYAVFRHTQTINSYTCISINYRTTHVGIPRPQNLRNGTPYYHRDVFFSCFINILRPHNPNHRNFGTVSHYHIVCFEAKSSSIWQVPKAQNQQKHGDRSPHISRHCFFSSCKSPYIVGS